MKQKIFRFGYHPVAQRVRLIVLGRTLWLSKRKKRAS